MIVDEFFQRPVRVAFLRTREVPDTAEVAHLDADLREVIPEKLARYPAPAASSYSLSSRAAPLSLSALRLGSYLPEATTPRTTPAPRR